MPPVQNPVNTLYNRWERFLNKVSSTVGGDRELDQLSEKLLDIKKAAYRDNALSAGELEGIYGRMEVITQAYTQLARARGYPVGESLPTTKEAFRVYGEDQEIHYQWLAGKNLRGGALGELVSALNSGNAVNSAEVDGLTRKISFDLVASASPQVAVDKLHLLRAQLARVGDRGAQKAVLDAVGNRLDQELATWRQGKLAPISRATFDATVSFQSTVAVRHTPLPDSVRGTNQLFPNRPIAGWEATTRTAVHGVMDDMAASGKLFLSRVPVDGKMHTVAVKLDLNLGADGPPSVTDPATAGATVADLLQRAKAEGKQIGFTVGDSSGGENVPLGRRSMDIMRDTGNYHHALKAGLQFASEQGSNAAKDALGSLEAVEARGVYLGSKEDTQTTAAQLKLIEAAAAPYVRCVDYDDAGYTSVDPELGPVGLASWGTREFRIAKPWVEAEFRVHVARGASTHLLAGWTGATKGLIGLQAFGLRPVDQGMDKRGDSILGALPLLTQVAGFAAIFQRRTGMNDLMDRVANSDDPGLKGQLAELKSKWQGLMESSAASAQFRSGAAALADELKADKARGMADPDLMDKMRSRTRALLDDADRVAPGFRQAFWDGIHQGTRFAMVAARNFRAFIPNEMKDHDAGARIGLLTSLPHPSDLVIQSQPKMGEGGGPDAYHQVRDVGVIIASTDEPSADVMAWKLSGKTDNIHAHNIPVNAALRFGRGPMHADEIVDASAQTRP